MRWYIAFILLLGCESKPAAPKVVDANPGPIRKHLPHRVQRENKVVLEHPKVFDAWRGGLALDSELAWDDAAEAAQVELDACACADAAYVVVIARKNALLAAPEDPPPGDEPAPVPPRIEALVEALDAFVAVAEPDDPDLPGMKFLAANALYRFRQPDAIERLEAQLRDHPADVSAEYAANTLLDLLMRSGRTDELRVWVERLRADEVFLSGREALRATLQQLHDAFAG